MTIGVSTSKTIIAGSGSLGPFAFAFPIDDESDLRVIKRSTDGVDSVLAINTDYTVSAGPWSAGGTVSTTAAVAVGEKLLIKIQLEATQETDFPLSGIFPSDDVEQALDRLTLLVQQAQEIIGRSLQLQETTAFSTPYIGDPSAAGDVVTYDGTGFSFAQIATLSPTDIVVTTFGQSLITRSDALNALLLFGDECKAVQGGRISGSNTIADQVPSLSATMYLVPDVSGLIALNTSSVAEAWQLYTFERGASAPSLSLAPFSNGKAIDIFAYASGTQVLLEGVEWTNSTTRATAIENALTGIYLKSGDMTRRYLGTVYKTGGGAPMTLSVNTNSGNQAYMGIWNYYNRRLFPLQLMDSTNTWTYSLGTARQARGSALNQLTAVLGVANEARFHLTARAEAENSTATLRGIITGIGIDSSTVIESRQIGGNNIVDNTARYGIAEGHLTSDFNLAAGVHDFRWLEIGAGADTQTWHGDNGGSLYRSGLFGFIEG